ncbi:MAG TPA: ABC transporter ATP-binding protein [Solirubrobacteraceae bacterium]|nr:ABC transporter ATP-binding protein [Solirubrobacteraceae bacterium]
MNLARDSAPATIPTSTQAALEIHDLTVAFPTQHGVAIVVAGVSLSVAAGEVKGIVGESGSGKTMLCRAILGLIPWPGAIVHGEIRWKGQDLVKASGRQLRRIRGLEVSMIFQDPASALDPVFTIGDQIAEPLRVHRGMSRREAEREAIELLGRVGIPSPRERFHAYPHQLSGGMRQRAMIAIAISCRPELILADEPTTSLDVTIQEQILGLLADLRDELGMSMILVSHDLGVVAQNADSMTVMYAGHTVETGPTGALFAGTRHPYTAGLIDALPSIEVRKVRLPLAPIPGQPPALDELPLGCPFAPRCSHAAARCREVDMSMRLIEGTHTTACPFAEEVMGGS